MTIHGVPDAEADVRWRDCVARGAASDRRTTKRMTGLMFLIAIGSGNLGDRDDGRALKSPENLGLSAKADRLLGGHTRASCAAQGKGVR
jgi:hypothetical protein